MSSRMRAISGARTRMPWPHQSTRVELGMSAPMRAKISFCRYSGRWSSNLATSMCARRPGPTILRGMGRDGAGVWVIFSHRRQDFFSRAISITFSLAVISSRISLTSSPSSRRSPPQSGQASPGSSTMRSRGVSSLTRGFRRRGFCSDASVDGASGEASSSPSGPALEAAATSRDSSASSSCSISRSIFSELAPNFCFLSRAI